MQYRMESKGIFNPVPAELAKMEAEILDTIINPDTAMKLIKQVNELVTLAFRTGAETEKIIGPREEWSNNACLGYVIAGLRGSDYEEETQEIVRCVSGQFDWVTIGEAKQIYNHSPY